MGAGSAELMDIMKTDFLLNHVHNYDLTYIDSLTPMQRTMLISMLLMQLEEDKKKNKT